MRSTRDLGPARQVRPMLSGAAARYVTGPGDNDGGFPCVTPVAIDWSCVFARRGSRETPAMIDAAGRPDALQPQPRSAQDALARRHDNAAPALRRGSIPPVRHRAAR